jgi:hypothetical protein
MRLIMRDPKAFSLFEEIFKKTLAGKIPWQPTAEEGEFVASMLGKYTLVLRRAPNTNPFEQPGPPSVLLLDEKGNSIVEITDSIDGIDEDRLRTLAVFTRRTALQADQKIDELLQEFKKEDDVPF